MKLLITGGSGFIATNFFHYLQKTDECKDLDIRMFDRRYGQDLCNENDVNKAWEWKPDTVIHFASRTETDISIKDPRLFWKDNLDMQINVLEACRRYDTKLVQISSSEVYGTAEKIPQTEEHSLNPHSPYGVTKLAQERACYSWYKTYGLDTVIIRLFNPYGPYQPANRVIPIFIKLSTQGLPLTVYGKGTARRDWVYILDVVRGIWMCTKDLSNGEVVNICTNKSWNLLELSNKIINAVNKVVSPSRTSIVTTIAEIADRPGHIEHLEGSYDKIKRLLGWKPEYTLNQGLIETVKWYLYWEFNIPSIRSRK